jgi:membrane-associated phospholipid phosphatase
MKVCRFRVLARAIPLALAFFLAVSFGARAQEAQPPAPVVDPAAPSFPRLVVIDVRDVLTAPLSWKAPQWERFSLGVAAVGAAALLDGTVRDAERRDHNRATNQIAQDFEPLGNAAAFGVLSAFYVEGLLGDDERAKSVAKDGLIASLIAGGFVTPAVKFVAGRARPREANGTFDFKPFSGASSFPSGHTTEAFAVASVIAAEYDSRWIKGISYGTAVLVGFARVHHQAHFFSDVTAGALIGSAVGRAVVHRNARNTAAHYHLAVVPLRGPKDQPGMGISLAF